jgi:cation diffusion facilitator CzcD-associated flavoprotein CzcO
MSRNKVDTVIVGAGPYGLSLASHLSHRGIERRIFGFPMRTWRHMPPGMNLKSFGFATSIPTPKPHYTLPEYCRSRGLEDFEPISFETYSEYGEWFQQQLVPDVEQVQVRDVSRSPGGFSVGLETGERFDAARVIVAAGLAYFTRVPEVLASLPKDLVTHGWHTSDYLKRGQYSGRDILVVGAGQTALEAAALLHEGGARVQILARRDVWWSDRFGKRSLLEALRAPNSVMGPGRENWVLQHIPMLAYYLPDDVRIRFTRKHLGAFGAWWLRDRVEGKVPILRQTALVSATEKNGRALVAVRAASGEERVIEADHIISATGYEPSIERLTFLSPELAGQIRRIERAPALSPYFESSVPGLYFVGPVAAFSFGPLVRFVAGAAYTIPKVASHIARRRRQTASTESVGERTPTESGDRRSGSPASTAG